MTLLIASTGANVGVLTSDAGVTTAAGVRTLPGKVAVLPCGVVLAGAGSLGVHVEVRRLLMDARSFGDVLERIEGALFAAIGTVETTIREHGAVAVHGGEPTGSIAVAVGWDGGPVGVVAMADGLVDLAGHAAMPSEPIADDPDLVELWNATAAGAGRDALLDLHRRVATVQMRAVRTLIPPVVAHVVGPGGIEKVTLIEAPKRPMTVGAVLPRKIW